MDESKPGLPDVVRQPPMSDSGNASATFGPFPNNQGLSVHVKADNLNIHSSGLSALERIAEKNPEIASQIIASTDGSIKVDGRKYITSAICAAVVAMGIIIGSAAVIISTGVTAGLMFFLACVAACSIITVMFTGKSQDISWTVKLFDRATGGASSAKPKAPSIEGK